MATKNGNTPYQNSLIDNQSEQTLTNVRDALAVLHHLELGNLATNDSAVCGLGLFVMCAQRALDYEIEVMGAARRANKASAMEVVS